MSRVSRRELLGSVGGAGIARFIPENRGEPEAKDADSGNVVAETDVEPRVASSNETIKVGMSQAPQTLNLLTASDKQSIAAIDPVYDTGIVHHPETGDIVPWAFESWTVDPSNVGTNSPTIVGELRSDLSFTDGTALRAEDVQFTIQYVQNQQPDSDFWSDRFSAVSDVTVDSPSGTTVNFFLSEKSGTWPQDVFGTYILPKHIWSNVSDHTSYVPRNSGGPIGSGPWVLDSFNWENWFQFEPRSNVSSTYPLPSTVDFLHDNAPLMNALRLEVFGSEAAIFETLQEGNIDIPLKGVGLDKAKVAQNQIDNLNLSQTDDTSWGHFSFNSRRVPLDDVGFRQLLVKLFDWEYVIRNVQKGINAAQGSYATPKAYENWRPPEPTEISSFNGIPIPDLTFPGKRGEFRLDSAAISSARDFLVNHDRANHTYSFEDADITSATASDGKVLHVNGSPLTQAHTDNSGNAGQGPLEVSFNPPQQDTDEAKVALWWVGALKTIGIPIRVKIESFNAQIPKVYDEENFDIFAMGWVNIGIANDHYKQLFGRWGADLDNSVSDLKFNPMAYTGADTQIENQSKTMDPASRQDLTKNILARIWSDAPTLVAWYDKVNHPTTTALEGWVHKAGGVANKFSWLNVRPQKGPPPLPGFANSPTDPNGDGLFEDLNGDGSFDVADVEAFYTHLDSDVVQNNAQFFDFNNDGIVDVGDVQSLYNELTSSS